MGLRDIAAGAAGHCGFHRPGRCLAAIPGLFLSAGVALACEGVCAMPIDGPAVPVPVPAYPGGGHCILDPDRVTIRDAGMGRAVVTYYNSGFGCSGGLSEVMTTPDGVSVRVVITVNADADAERERIVVIPLTDGMFAFPPEADLKDGETVEIVVMGGLA